MGLETPLKPFMLGLLLQLQTSSNYKLLQRQSSLEVTATHRVIKEQNLRNKALI